MDGLKSLLAEIIENGFSILITFLHYKNNMADVQKTLEVIFIEAAKVFGKEKSKQMIETLTETVKAETKETKPKKENSKPKKENSGRITRMTPTLANKLKAELVKVGITFSNDEKEEKKQFDKFKKEFTSYVEELTNDDFTAKPLDKHMEDFANSKKPVETTTTNTAPKKAEKVEQKTEKAAPKKESTSIPSGPTNAANIHDVSLEELQAIEMIATPENGPIGVYWDADEGRWVRGPERDDDEDMTEKKFQGKTYAIGDKTGRVYEVTDDRDIFAGHIGVGAFKDLTL